LKVPFFDLRVLDVRLRQDLIRAVERVFDHGRLFLGPEVEELEWEVSKFLGSKYAVGVDSGSSALFLALKASGIGPGDEVITTPLTWVISANAIAACGATPVFADVLDDFTIDSKSAESMITARTKAIVPMHYAGKMCDMTQLLKLAKSNDLLIIEDSAQAFGASINGRMAGTFSVAAGFSMNPMKAFGGFGEAGIVVTDEESIYRRLKKLRHAGTTSDPKKVITNYCEEVSLNHKMDTINAALLLVALKYLPEKQRRKQAIADLLLNGLSQMIVSQNPTAGYVHARYVYPIIVEKRNQFKAHLEKNSIETKIMHEPLACDAPVYKSCRSSSDRAAKLLASSLAIPSHEKLDNHQVQYVIDVCNEFVTASS
jgi:dTDP-4-amino-4,6-dideoxygalactose transaminase